MKRIFFKKKPLVNGLTSSFSNSYNIRELYPPHLNTRRHVWKETP